MNTPRPLPLPTQGALKLVFAGTPPFAAQALAALHAAGHEITLVLTQPDRPAGRGQKPTPSAVKQWAQAHRLPLHQPTSLRDPATHEPIRAACAAGAVCMVVAAYGLILPPAVLALPLRGCLNIHASLLPRWRGAAPIQRAIAAGDTESGITLMQMESGLDSGPLWACHPVPLTEKDHAASLHDTLAALGAQAIVALLASSDWRTATHPPERQNDALACYANKISKQESPLDWREAAEPLARRVRAFDPFPGCTLRTPQGEVVKVWQAEALPSSPPHAQTDRAGENTAQHLVMQESESTGKLADKPGTLLALDAQTAEVQCGSGAHQSRLRLIVAQRAGGRRAPAAQVLRTLGLAVGMCLR